MLLYSVLLAFQVLRPKPDIARCYIFVEIIVCDVDTVELQFWYAIARYRNQIRTQSVMKLSLAIKHSF